MPGPKAPLKLSQYRGKAVLLALISTGCEHCITAAEALVQVQKDFGPRGLQVVAGVADNLSALSVPPFVERYKVNFPVGYVDKSLFLKITNNKPADVLYVPTLLFIDPKGMVRLQIAGNHPSLQGAALVKTIRGAAEDLVRETAPARAKK